MKIETEYNIDDNVYCLIDEKIDKFIVCAILIDYWVEDKKVITNDISYNITDKNRTIEHGVSESNLFKTKKELLNKISNRKIN